MGLRVPFVTLCLIAVISLCHCKNGSWSWESCGTPNDRISIDDVNLLADDTKISVTYSLENVVNDAVITVNVKYGVMHSYTGQFDICDLVSCPVKEGTGSFDFENPVKPFSRPGTYTLTATVKDKRSDAQLACLKLVMHK